MARSDAETVIKLYEQAKTDRQYREDDWRKAAAYCLPHEYGLWQSDGHVRQHNSRDAAKRIAYDSTGARALPKYCAIVERISTPQSQKWHGLRASDASLQRKRRVREYMESVTDTLFKLRSHPRAKFRATTAAMYEQLGVYGNAPVFIGARKRTRVHPQPGLSYVSCGFRDVFILTDDEGNVTDIFRRFWLNVRTFRLKFPDASLPMSMQAEGSKPSPDEGAFFEFVHHVCLRSDDHYDPDALDARRHPVCSSYVAVKDKVHVTDDAGYASIPYILPRVGISASSVYGNSPAVRALAAMGGASAMKKTNLKQGNKAVDPVLLAHDDSMINGTVDLRPGAVNYGAVSREGRELIKALPVGDFRVGFELLQDERSDVDDCFFVTLFQILTEKTEMTATEVLERIAEKAALMSPTMGALQSEGLGPMIERELDVSAELGLLPPMPPELVEAQGEYEITYTSPMAKAMYMEEVTGFWRAVEMALNVSQVQQDPSILDHFDFDAALPEISSYLAVPERWMRERDAVTSRREGRNAEAQEAQVMQNAPALASAAKTAMEMGKQ